MQSPFLLNNAQDVHPTVTLMAPPNSAVLMDAETLVEHAHLDKSAVGATALVLPTAVVDNAGMMVAEVTHVDLALMVKPVKMESVLELEAEPVEPESVVMTELEVLADHALLDKDAEVESVSATMTVTKETADQQLLMRDLSVPVKAVEPAHPDLPVAPLDNARLLLPVTLISLLLTDLPTSQSPDNVLSAFVDQQIPLIHEMDSFGLLHLLPGMLQEALVLICSVPAVLDIQSVMRPSV